MRFFDKLSYVWRLTEINTTHFGSEFVAMVWKDSQLGKRYFKR